MRGDAIDTAILGWLAGIGAAGADEVAAACAISGALARARLRALERDGLCFSERLLCGAPALCGLTRRGLAAAGRAELAVARVSAASAAHQLAVARVAVALAGGCDELHGERELRAWERAAGRPLASAEVGWAGDGGVALHRPDLVAVAGGAQVAIEVELTVKAPERLARIVRGWARSRLVAGVVYYATPAALRAVRSAVARECAQEAVAVLALERAGELPVFARRVLSQARPSVGGPTLTTTRRA
jgi:hypothetical protein